MNRLDQRYTIAAFLGIVLIGGLNGIAIKYSNAELAPFWGAALRFGLAAALLGLVVVVRRIDRPRGKALAGSALYGILNFGAFYALVYWGLLETPAGLAMIVLATVPLLTRILAVVQRLEKFSTQRAVGSLIALAGMAIVFSDQLGSVPASTLSLLAILAAAAANAEANVVVKLLPRSHPVANNALAMAIGFVVLLAVSLIAGEARAFPTTPTTIAATAYLVLLGSVALFMLFLFVIERWTASATSYVLLLMPLVTVVAAAFLLGEPIRPIAIAGGVLVLVGVYAGTFASGFTRLLPAALKRTQQRQPVELEINPCP